jgi:diguanylate cyclase (GGDEF)-like protein/PAS domain S-box-containing protein
MKSDSKSRKRLAKPAKVEADSQQADDLYRILAEKSFGGVYVVQDGIFQYLNSHAAVYAGYTSEELTGKKAPDIVHPEDKEIQRKHASEMLQGKRSCPHEFRIINKNGETRWIMETVTPIFYEGRPAVLGNSMDITSLKEAAKKLEEQKDMVTSIIDSIPEAVIVVKNWGIIFASNAVEKVFGWSPADLAGKHASALYRKDGDFKEIDNYIQFKLQSQRNCNQEVHCRRKDDRIIICRQHTGLIGENLRTGDLIIVYDDITERKRAEELIKESEKRYQELSIKDNLTKLYNNRRFYELLKSEIVRTNRYYHPLTLLMMDIDNFKHYNDTYGHVEGDAVLARFAEVLHWHIRETDHACRYGGEEFVVILPETLGDTGVSISERIREEFKKEAFSPQAGVSEHVTVSVGVAQYIKEEDLQDFIKRADKRMYKAKQKGKDQVCY